VNDVASGTCGVPPVRIVEHGEDRPVVIIRLNLTAVAAEQMLSEVFRQLCSKITLSAENKRVIGGQWHGRL
jgi:hypothetical protein